MIGRIRKLLNERDIIWSLTLKDFQARYLGSRLGWLWGIVTPLCFIGVIGMTFHRIFKIPVERPTVFILAGFFPWIFLSEGLGGSVRILIERKRLFVQYFFSKECVVLAHVLSGLAYLLIGLLLLLPLAAADHPRMLLWLPALAALLALQGLLVFGLALLVAVANVFWRDIRHLLDMFLIFWFWATPVFYPPAMLPESLRWVRAVNPMDVYAGAYRSLLWQGRPPEAGTMLALALWAVAALAAGLFAFSRAENRILKWL